MKKYSTRNNKDVSQENFKRSDVECMFKNQRGIAWKLSGKSRHFLDTSSMMMLNFVFSQMIYTC